jgi:hypothetical protein
MGMVDLQDPIFIERKVKKAVEHSEADLMLLKMDKEVYFHQAVAPICLPHHIGYNLSGKVKKNLKYYY